MLYSLCCIVFKNNDEVLLFLQYLYSKSQRKFTFLMDMENKYGRDGEIAQKVIDGDNVT